MSGHTSHPPHPNRESPNPAKGLQALHLPSLENNQNKFFMQSNTVSGGTVTYPVFAVGAPVTDERGRPLRDGPYCLDTHPNELKDESHQVCFIIRHGKISSIEEKKLKR